MSSVMERVKNTEQRLFVPGRSDGADLSALQAAIKRHDEDLFLARHEKTGDWCIFIENMSALTQGKPMPVIGLGRDLPSEDTIIERLRAADTRIHGSEILTGIAKNNEDAKAAKKRLADDATAAAAEAYEWAHRDIKGYSGRYANVKGRLRNGKG
jgi:hypothetical protein